MLLALSFYHYRRTNPPLPAKVKYPLLALRAIALIALFLTLLEPVISYGLNGERRQRVTVALDVSGSMRQSQDGSSRLKTVDSVFASGDNLLGRLSEDYDITWRYFADSLMKTREAVNAESSDKNTSGSISGTALGESIAELAQSDIDQPADFWLLISDGINNSGREPVQVSDELQTPLYTIGVGEQSQDFDIEIAEIGFNPVAYVGAETPINISLRWRGVGETALEAQVVLREVDSDGATVKPSSSTSSKTIQRIKLGRGELSSEIELQYTPTKPGAVFLSAIVTTAANERRAENNSRVFSIKVLKSRLKVALVSETLSWDYKFIKQALNENERVEVSDFVEKQEGLYLGDKFPATQGAVNEFDIIILLNPSAARGDNRYRLLQNYVSGHGGGLFVVGGAVIGNGNGVGSLLPLTVASGYRADLQRSTAISLRGENILHPALRIAKENEDVREVWRSFPPFVSVTPLTEVDSDSGEVLVLAESDYQIEVPKPRVLNRIVPPGDTAQSGPTKPIILLAAQKRGSGKVLQLHGAPLWRMAFQSVSTEQTTEHFSEFINGAVNWLSVTEDISPVKIEPERSIYSRGEVMVFSGSAFDQSYRALDGYSADVFLYGQNNTTDTLVATLQEVGVGSYRAEFSGLTPGTYRYEGRSFVDGELIKTDTGRVQVTQYSLEQRETRPDFGSLQTIAQKTGGKYAHISRLDDLAQVFSGEKIIVSEEVEFPLRGDWRFLAIFIAALSIEWFIRKRLQLL